MSGAQFDDESGALPGRFIGQSVSGLGDGIGSDRVKSVAGFTLFQMLGKVQGPLAGGSLTNALGTEDAVCRTHEAENPRPGVRSKGHCEETPAV